MNASDFDARQEATSRFLDEGLGMRLTQNSQILMSAVSQDFLGELQGLAIKFACGNIAERVLWLAYGVWIGYFNPVPPVSEFEKGFLKEYSGRLSYIGMPTEIEQLCENLGRLDLPTSTFFYRETFPFFPLTRPMPEWFPVFQAILIIQELLNEPAITPLFLFLQQGNLQAFKNRVPNPDGVFSRLLEQDYVRAFRDDFEEPESVVAGFIRFTEFLSAMDGIFPNIDTRTSPDLSEEIPDRIVDRYILSSYLGQFRWRFPSNEAERFEAVIMSFSNLVSTQFEQHRSMGIIWSFNDTYTEIMRLSLRFFPLWNGEGAQAENDPEGIVDPAVLEDQRRRIAAIQRRVRALGGDPGMMPR